MAKPVQEYTNIGLHRMRKHVLGILIRENKNQSSYLEEIEAEMVKRELLREEDKSQWKSS